MGVRTKWLACLSAFGSENAYNLNHDLFDTNGDLATGATHAVLSPKKFQQFT
jgi:hypothetical protein